MFLLCDIKGKTWVRLKYPDFSLFLRQPRRSLFINSAVRDPEGITETTKSHSRPADSRELLTSLWSLVRTRRRLRCQSRHIILSFLSCDDSDGQSDGSAVLSETESSARSTPPPIVLTWIWYFRPKPWRVSHPDHEHSVTLTTEPMWTNQSTSRLADAARRDKDAERETETFCFVCIFLNTTNKSCNYQSCCLQSLTNTLCCVQSNRSVIISTAICLWCCRCFVVRPWPAGCWRYNKNQTARWA